MFTDEQIKEVFKQYDKCLETLYMDLLNRSIRYGCHDRSIGDDLHTLLLIMNQDIIKSLEEKYVDHIEGLRRKANEKIH